MIIHAYLVGAKGATIVLCGRDALVSQMVAAAEFDKQIKVTCPDCRVGLDRLALDYQRRMGGKPPSSRDGQG